MKKGLTVFTILAAALLFLAWTAGGASPAKNAAMEMKGTIIDNNCANANKKNLAVFIKTHTKECALMPACMATGYALYSGSMLYKFDKASTSKIADFLKLPGSKLDVVVMVKMTGK